MARSTIYCVQTFEQKGGKLVQAGLRQLKAKSEAERIGANSADKFAGVLVYSVDADPEFNDWGDPVMIARYGQAPDEAD